MAERDGAMALPAVFWSHQREQRSGSFWVASPLVHGHPDRRIPATRNHGRLLQADMGEDQEQVARVPASNDSSGMIDTASAHSHFGSVANRTASFSFNAKVEAARKRAYEAREKAVTAQKSLIHIFEQAAVRETLMSRASTSSPPARDRSETSFSNLRRSTTHFSLQTEKVSLSRCSLQLI